MLGRHGMRALSVVLTVVGVGCGAGPVVCEEKTPQAIACLGNYGQPPNGIGEIIYVPDQWLPTVSSDWGCDFELDRDAGTATWRPRGTLCTSRPAVDNSDDLKPFTRGCMLPEGPWLVQGPKNALQVTVRDGGLDCMP